MTTDINQAADNYRQRFIFPDAGVWGASVRLSSSWREILEIHDYDEVVASKLGEAVVATVLLTTHLKRQGSLILQTQSDGPLHTLVAQSTKQGTVRGLARSNGSVSDGRLDSVFGKGKLMMTIDNEQDERYQGIVALQGKDLGEALETYFSQSEQLSTRLWLEADLSGAAGFLLQQLPNEQISERISEIAYDESDEARENWNRVTLLGDTLRPGELLGSTTEEIVHRLFHQEKIRRFVPEELRFHCGCSKSRIEAMLIALGRQEVEDMITERGCVEVDCEFCNRHYRLESDACRKLFVEPDEITDEEKTKKQLH